MYHMILQYNTIHTIPHCIVRFMSTYNTPIRYRTFYTRYDTYHISYDTDNYE